MQTIRPFERITASSESILESPVTKRILKNLEKFLLLPVGFSKPEIISTLDESRKISFSSHSKQAPENNPVGYGKRILHLTTHSGAFTKQCPGTNQMLCCQYHIINQTSNCPFDCSYCYLPTYLNQPMLTFFINEEDVHKQVRALCERHEIALKQGVVGGAKKFPLRIGTGEIADSLALDPITEFSEPLANVLADYPNVRLELKTKSKNIEHLLHLKRKDHVVFGWSMNPPEIVDSEEHGTAKFTERVKAAQLAAEAGFGVAFHFDPMIYIPNWKTIYQDAIVYLLNRVPEESIQWVSLGALRYQPQLKGIAIKRFPNSKLFLEASTSGDDGKVRYLREIRSEMFSTLNKTFKELAPKAYTYLCMEPVPVWEKALGRMPDRGF